MKELDKQRNVQNMKTKVKLTDTINKAKLIYIYDRKKDDTKPQYYK